MVPMMRRRTTHRLVAAAALGLLAGVLMPACAHAPARRVEGYTPAAAEKAAVTAMDMIGRPYRYRGETPAGFDCSGLVRYSYLAAGMDVPHGTDALRRMTRSVGPGNAAPGDLVFFSQRGKKYSHVGIYVGDDRFVHAPSTGGSVRTDSMTDSYWKKHYLDTRRFP